MIERRKTTTGQVRYRVKIHTGGKRYKSIGTYPSKAEAKLAEAQAMLAPNFNKVLVGAYVETYLDDYQNRYKLSSYTWVRNALSQFRDEFGHRQLGSISDEEAERWAAKHRWAVTAVITLFNRAVRKRTVAHNPFAGLSHKTRGRADLEPLTVEEIGKLATAAYDAQTNLGETQRAETLRALVMFCAYTGIRQGEAFALEWTDIDLPGRRVWIKRRVYHGHIDTPKSGKWRKVVITPEARDALLTLGVRADGLVFRTKTGKRLSQGLFGNLYWPYAVAKFGRKVDFHELRHFAGHYFYVTRDLPSRVVATQLGHANPRMVEELYGHFKSGALDELDRAVRDVPPLKAVPRESHGAQGA